MKATFQNLTNPDSPATLAIGDKWQLTINTVANSQVMVKSKTSASDKDETSFYGQTDPLGNLVTTGTISTSHAGTWVQDFFVPKTNETANVTFSVPTVSGVEKKKEDIPVWLLLAGSAALGIYMFWDKIPELLSSPVSTVTESDDEEEDEPDESEDDEIEEDETEAA